MHRRCEGGGEGCGKRRRLVRHMWPATRVEAPPPPAQGPATTPSSSSVPPPSATSCLPSPTTPSARKQEHLDSPRPVSPDSFVKDGREIRVGDFALFQANDAPPFVGLIRWIEKKEEGHPKLRVSWLYRPADVKLNKGIQLNAAPNEIFYSFHQDDTSSVALLHPCKVAFLRKGVELLAGISCFVCRRVYDIDNKCLWWLTDKDYINERQEEVNRLLYKTRLEMHAAVQSGGRSPKRLNGASAAQQKSASDGTQNCGSSKGKKRERTEQVNDTAKRDRDRDDPFKVDEAEPGIFKVDNVKSEITKIIDKGGLLDTEAVEKLVHCMQLDRTERKIDFAGRVILAEVIAATESPDCLGRFVQLRGLRVLDDWLQEAHKGKSGEGSSPKETDKPNEDFLLALLRALAKLPINLNALQSCSIGKSVNHLRSHKNMDIQKKAKILVENWKKRVDAEMKSNEKAAASGQPVPSPGKAGFPEISNAGNRRSGSSEPSTKNQVSQVSSSKILTAKSGSADVVVKLTPAISGSSKLPNMPPANIPTNSKDQPCKSNGGSELPTVKEERSSSSSQSLNNSHSCSSDHAKTIGSSWKEDARSSTAASGSKTSAGSSRGHRRGSNGCLGSGIQKEPSAGRSGSLDRSSLPEKSPQSGTPCEKGGDTPSDHASGHRLIVRFPNPGRSPARSASGGSFEDPSVTGSRVSSPVLADKHEHDDRRVKLKTEHPRPHLASDANAESWHSNDIKGPAGSEEGDKSPPCDKTSEDGRSRIAEEAGKGACASRVACSSHANEKGICSSESKAKHLFNPMSALIEIKYSEAGPSLQGGDDTAMNLLASVAGEISKSELDSASTSPRNSSANKGGCEGENDRKMKDESDVDPSQLPGSLGEVDKVPGVKQEKNDPCLAAKAEQHQAVNGPCPVAKAFESSAKTVNHEEERTKRCSSLPVSVDSQGEHKNARSAPGKVEDGCSSTPDAVGATLGGHRGSFVSIKKSESLPAPGSSLSAGKQLQGLKSTVQSQLLGVSDHTKAVGRCESTGRLDLKSSVLLEATEAKKSDCSGVGGIALKEEEKKEQCSSTSADLAKSVVSAAPPLGSTNGINKTKDPKDSSSESCSHVTPRGIVSQETARSKRQNPEKSSDDEGGKEELVSSDEGSSFAAKGKSSTGAKLDFDLNEGISGDEGQQSEPAAYPMICSSSVHLAGISPFISPISSGMPAQITVAAPAKGPFVPSENLLRVKSETGWKGSAATSAFRPAEPRKTLEMPLATHDISVSGTARKQSRPVFEIDLNVADDQALEEDVPQSSAQTTGSESGNTRSRDGTVRSAGIELDLNRADEVAENGQFLSMFPSRQLPGIFSNTDRNSSRDFDLNNGPSLDEAGMEPAPRILASKTSSSIPFLPQVAGIRMNNGEASNISPWFASGSHGVPVAMQSFLPIRGEQPYPNETAPGSQRILASAADSGQFGNDSSRTPVISTSPTMVFHPPAYQYAGFPFIPNMQGFSIGSTPFMNSAPAGVSYFPTIAPSLVGPSGVLPGQHARPYGINLPEGSSVGGHDGSRKWGRQGLDLNSGPGIVEAEAKDERMPLPVRQNLLTSAHTFVEDQTRIYQMTGVGIKRKEPEGSWDAERSQYKQLSWQ